jgi:hypothetical protein
MMYDHRRRTNHFSTDDFLQDPPPYSLLAGGSGSSLQVSTLPRLPPDLPPTNYLHVRDHDNAVKQKVLLDLSIPPTQTYALSTGTKGSDISNLILDSHDSPVSGEVWVLRSDAGDSAARRSKDRVRLEFLSHNSAVKAVVVSRNPSILRNNFFESSSHLAARSCVDSGASSVSPNRSEGVQRLCHDLNTAHFPRATHASHIPRSSVALVRAGASRHKAVCAEPDTYVLCR